jgi:hypothetical protein
MASVSIGMRATTQYPTITVAAPRRNPHRRIVSVAVARRRPEIDTSTPPQPIPSSASPMTRYV